MCIVFSQDGTGDLQFEDFLDMMSVFSEQATRDVKASYAFRIYGIEPPLIATVTLAIQQRHMLLILPAGLDYDGDGYIGREDLVNTLTALCGVDELSKEEVDEVATKILVEADLDGDERLSYVEFDNVVARAPDFVNSFRVRI